MHRIFAITCAFVIAGCATFPELDANLNTAQKNATFPEFLTKTELQTLDQPRRTVALPNLQTRLARLQARARALRGPILSRVDRRRLAQNIR